MKVSVSGKDITQKSQDHLFDVLLWSGPWGTAVPEVWYLRSAARKGHIQ